MFYCVLLSRNKGGISSFSCVSGIIEIFISSYFLRCNKLIIKELYISLKSLDYILSGN